MAPQCTCRRTCYSTIISRKESLEIALCKELNIEKRERMDLARKKQCHLILKKLRDRARVLLLKHIDLSRIEWKLNCRAYPTTF